MCVTGAGALDYVSLAVLNGMGIPAWSRLQASAMLCGYGDEDSDDEVPFHDNQPQLCRLVSGTRPQEGVAEANAANIAANLQSRLQAFNCKKLSSTSSIRIVTIPTCPCAAHALSEALPAALEHKLIAHIDHPPLWTSARNCG